MVETTETRTLVRLAHRRFRNFSEAAESVVDTLADVIPGVVILGQFEPDDGICRVIDARGSGVEGLKRGSVLPLAPSNGTGSAESGGPDPALDGGLDTGFLRALGAQAWLGAQLETSDGRIVGTLCALDAETGTYNAELAALLGIASRLLSHEWENVERRVELRRLKTRLCEGSASTDPDTGLLNRTGFFDALEREWLLAERGTVESVLVAFRVSLAEENGANAEVMGKLALKIAAEVLDANARVTDRVGRIGEMTIAAILVGCSLEQAPAFIERFSAGLGRVTRTGEPQIEISSDLQALGTGPLHQELLQLADGQEPEQLPGGAEPAHEEAAG